MSGLVVLVGALALLNLLLTFGVIRRLREHTELLAGRAPASSPEPPSLPVGLRVSAFRGATTGGEPLTHESWSGDTLVAFISPDCSPCQERMPSLIETARLWPGGRQATMAVVIAEPDAAAEYAELLSPVARVAVEPPGGPIAAAFGVAAFPLFGVVDRSGRVLRSALEPSTLLLQEVAQA
ncbi:TlpA disulfide reductase family protein [Planobispora longispora]|uniref:TlpA family protein n=1 Tax=Planobispora longispora TaxID=28887 RepID=A0A8J3W7P5_9ACTN|nr:TlpA disulfide reductase family protein [Planobispora longispora]BFE79714.1 TlpA family protein [Planobispora longispora]GIH78031.1 TlpA family protein [Planobispora longispora]